MIRIDLSRRESRKPLLRPSRGAIVVAAAVIAVLIGAGARAIEGGKETSGFPFVYGLDFRKSGAGGDLEGTCTAVLVRPRLLLTAAHCFEDGAELIGVSNHARVAGGAGNSTGISVDEKRAHPDYSTARNRSAAIDIAWIRLSGDAPIGDLPAIRVLRSFEERDAMLGAQATLVGYGSDEFRPADLRSYEGAGTKRTSTRRISQISPASIIIEGREGNTLAGDSGSPLLVGEGSSMELLGIAHGYTPMSRKVPVMKKNGQQKKTLFGKPKFREEITYGHSTWLAFDETNLCWVQKTSGVDLGMSCPTRP